MLFPASDCAEIAWFMDGLLSWGWSLRSSNIDPMISLSDGSPEFASCEPSLLARASSLNQ